MTEAITMPPLETLNRLPLSVRALTGTSGLSAKTVEITPRSKQPQIRDENLEPGQSFSPPCEFSLSKTKKK